MSYQQITALAPTLKTARYAVVIDGAEELPHLPFSECMVDEQTTLAVAALAVGEQIGVGLDMQVRRVV